MKHIRMACGLAAAVGALCVAAVPALADSKYFVAGIPGKTISLHDHHSGADRAGQGDKTP